MNHLMHKPSADSHVLQLIIGVLITLVLGFLLIFYGIPLIRQAVTPATNTTQIQIPDKVDVNIKKE